MTTLRIGLPIVLAGLALLGCPGPAKTAKTAAKTAAAKTAAAKTAAAKTAAKTAVAKTPDPAAKKPQVTYFAFKG